MEHSAEPFQLDKVAHAMKSCWHQVDAAAMMILLFKTEGKGADSRCQVERLHYGDTDLATEAVLHAAAHYLSLNPDYAESEFPRLVAKFARANALIGTE